MRTFADIIGGTAVAFGLVVLPAAGHAAPRLNPIAVPSEDSANRLMAQISPPAGVARTYLSDNFVPAGTANRTAQRIFAIDAAALADQQGGVICRGENTPNSFHSDQIIIAAATGPQALQRAADTARIFVKTAHITCFSVNSSLAPPQTLPAHGQVGTNVSLAPLSESSPNKPAALAQLKAANAGQATPGRVLPRQPDPAASPAVLSPDKVHLRPLEPLPSVKLRPLDDVHAAPLDPETKTAPKVKPLKFGF